MLLSSVPAFFKERRDRLMKAHPGTTFIFPSSGEILRNPDVAFPFRQESSFYYLCGFEEPESFLVLTPSTQKAYRSILFVRQKDAHREMWTGERYGVEGAMKVFGMDEAYPIEEFDKQFSNILSGAEKLGYRLGLSEATDRRVIAGLDSYRSGLGRTGKGLLSIFDPQIPVGELRLFKSPAELESQRKACEVSALSFNSMMKFAKPGMNEGEVEAFIDYEFRRNGCKRLGYGSIVAGGVNAACLHYTFNNQPLKDGELLLVDAGGEYEYYTADITRTFPIGRKFTPAQAKVYDLVLKAEKECIGLAKPGATLPDIHKHACDVITEGLLSLGLLKGKKEEILKLSGYNRFFPHRTSHYLGMDVHDVGLYAQDGEPRKLEPGMLFTIEPGFYVQPADKDAPAEYHNIGIRIEDDILVTKTGCEVLTKMAIKERAELEALKGA